MNLRKKNKEIAHIDMTPIIDVVFQLLAFFMLTSTFIKTSAINVDLPGSKTSDMQPVREVIITLYRSGEISLNDDKIPFNQLGIRIKDMYLRDKDLVVTIQGDKSVPYERIIETMDTVRLAGVTKLSLATIYKE